MTRDQIRDIAGKAVGQPDSGPVAAALDAIADAIDAAVNPTATRETRIVEPTETRGQ